MRLFASFVDGRTMPPPSEEDTFEEAQTTSSFPSAPPVPESEVETEWSETPS